MLQYFVDIIALEEGIIEHSRFDKLRASLLSKEKCSLIAIVLSLALRYLFL